MKNFRFPRKEAEKGLAKLEAKFQAGSPVGDGTRYDTIELAKVLAAFCTTPFGEPVKLGSCLSAHHAMRSLATA